MTNGADKHHSGIVKKKSGTPRVKPKSPKNSFKKKNILPPALAAQSGR